MTEYLKVPGLNYLQRYNLFDTKDAMANQQIVTVEWFDELKGIGEGKTLKGRTVFLNSKNIELSNHFVTLKHGESVFCETQIENNNLFATKIIRANSKRSDVEKATFLEPLPLEKSNEPTI